MLNIPRFQIFLTEHHYVQWENWCSSFSLLSKHRFFLQHCGCSNFDWVEWLGVSQTPSAVRPALCSSPIARLFACPFLLQFSVTPEFRSAISIFEFSQFTRILDHLCKLRSSVWNFQSGKMPIGQTFEAWERGLGVSWGEVQYHVSQPTCTFTANSF